MVKPLGIAIALSIGLGSFVGYSLQKLESSQPNQSQAIAAQSIPNPAIAPKIDRDALTLKLSLCRGSKPDPNWINNLTDKQLNDVTYEICKKAS